MKQNEFPPNWNEERVRAVIDLYERQTEEEAVAEYQNAEVQSDTEQAGRRPLKSKDRREYGAHDHRVSVVSEKHEDYDKDRK